MGQLVFSDESGNWSDPNCDIYVRSFVVFDTDEYDKKLGVLNRCYPNITKFKWSKSGDIRDDHDICNLMLNGTKIFISFTDLTQFRKKQYKIKQEVKGLNYDSLLEDFQERFELRDDLMNKVDQLLFLNVYEHQFLTRFSASTTDNLENKSFEVVYIGNPQQNNDDFEKIIRKIIQTEKVEFIKNEAEILGMGTADFVASAFKDILNKETNRNALDFYKKYIKPQNIGGSGKHPNPSYQFWPNGNKKYKNILEKIW